MYEGRRRQLGKLAFDVAKYFATLVGGTYLLKPDVLAGGIGWKTIVIVLGLLVIAWIVYPMGKDQMSDPGNALLIFYGTIGLMVAILAAVGAWQDRRSKAS